MPGGCPEHRCALLPHPPAPDEPPTTMALDASALGHSMQHQSAKLHRSVCLLMADVMSIRFI